jgi:ribosomal protein S18 acetylase RimI-like enzyme
VKAPDDRPPAWSLRSATEDDFDFLFRVKREALGEYIAATWGWDEEDQRARARAEPRAWPTQVIVFDGEDAGVLQVDRRGSELYVINILVLPAHQGRGLGSAILRELMDEAAWDGVPVTLQVLRANPRARALYERLGFVVTGETAEHALLRWDADG